MDALPKRLPSRPHGSKAARASSFASQRERSGQRAAARSRSIRVANRGCQVGLMYFRGRRACVMSPAGSRPASYASPGSSIVSADATSHASNFGSQSATTTSLPSVPLTRARRSGPSAHAASSSASSVHRTPTHPGRAAAVATNRSRPPSRIALSRPWHGTGFPTTSRYSPLDWSHARATSGTAISSPRPSTTRPM